MLTVYLEALLLTLVIEVPTVAVFYRGVRVRMTIVAIFANLFTHVTMHFVLPHLVGSYRSWLLVGETNATVCEALIYGVAYWRFTGKKDASRALFVSALANSLSFAAGLLLFR